MAAESFSGTCDILFRIVYGMFQDIKKAMDGLLGNFIVHSTFPVLRLRLHNCNAGRNGGWYVRGENLPSRTLWIEDCPWKYYDEYIQIYIHCIYIYTIYNMYYNYTYSVMGQIDEIM